MLFILKKILVIEKEVFTPWGGRYTCLSYISPRFKYSQAYNDRHMEQKETDSEWLNYSQMILYDN